MEKAKIKKIFAITFTAVSITAVIVANNMKVSGGIKTTPLLTNGKILKTASPRASVSMMELDEAAIESSMVPVQNYEKKVIMSADVSLQTSSLSDAESAIKKWVEKNNGYISYQNENTMNMNITAHIPSECFHSAMEECGDFGKITNKNINSQDVTDQYYDLKTRLENQRMLLEKLQSYLRNAKNVDEILKVETMIADTTSSIETMEGQYNRMSKEIQYSKVSFYISLPANRDENGIILPDTKSEFSEFISNIINFALHYVWSVLYIVLCGTMLTLLFMLLYWLCFGRIGLVRKMFDRIK